MENNKIKVLLIEDSIDDAELIKRKLEKSASSKFQVAVARKLNDGLERAEKNAPDLIISDLGLPDSHGLDTVTKILLAVPHIPLVVLSGFDDEDIAIKAVQSGAQDYLVKGQLDNSHWERTLFYSIERARLQDELDENTQKISKLHINLRKILDNSTDAIVVVGEERRILFANHAVDSLFGRKSKELLNLPFQYPLDAGKTSEITIHRADEKTTIAEMSVVNISWEGKPAHLVSMHDITERKAMEAALRSSEEKYRTIVEMAPDGIITVNLQGQITSCNEALARIGGVPMQDIMGKHFTDLPFFIPQDIAAYTKIFNSLLSGESIPPLEIPWHHTDGTTSILELRASLMKHNGKLVGIQAMIIDITERKRREKALRESEEKFFKAFMGSPQAIVITSLDNGVILETNDTFLELTGYSREELIGRKAIELDLWNSPEERERIIKTLNEQGIVKNLERQFRKKTGEMHTWLFSAQIVNIDNNPCMLSVTVDITERKKAEELLRKIDEMKSEFLSNVSHELRTPLQSISGFTKLIMNGKVPDPAIQQEFLQIIDRETMHLGYLINTLLDMSRLEAGQFQIYKKLTSVHNIFTDSIKMFHSLAREKDITLNESIPAKLPKMEVDSERMRQVIINLLSNAIKFSDPGSSINVKAAVQDSNLLFQVTDHGTGIHEEAMAHLFERFYRSEGETARGGMGLGLYISKQIIDAHGGQIWAESKFGEGSTFSFTLPLNNEGGKKNGEENSGNRRRSGNAKTNRLLSKARGISGNHGA